MSFYRPINHSMLRRCKNWDYCAPRIYTITLTLENRRLPLLGKLQIDSPPNTPPALVKAHIVPSKLGEVVTDCWQEIGRRYPEIQLLGFQLMEEHLHGTLFATRRLPKHLGLIIGGFKGGCTAAYRQLTGSQEQLFSKGFQDTILFHDGQLQRMLDYLADNPRRLAIKRLYPDFFQRLQDIPFQGGTLNGVGNPFLLSAPMFFPIQASRQITQEELVCKSKEMFQKINEGAVIVSPCLSQGERTLAHQALDAQAPLIVFRNMCFPTLYKPSGKYFDACANGKLLMVAPSQWQYLPGAKPLTRTDACILNAIAATICGKDPTKIQYAGMIPENLPKQIAMAIGEIRGN